MRLISHDITEVGTFTSVWLLDGVYIEAEWTHHEGVVGIRLGIANTTSHHEDRSLIYSHTEQALRLYYGEVLSVLARRLSLDDYLQEAVIMARLAHQANCAERSRWQDDRPCSDTATPLSHYSIK